MTTVNTLGPPQAMAESDLARAEVPTKVFDRSSFRGDFLVVIPDQTSEDFERDAPDHRFCEYFHGAIYMPSPVSRRHQEQALFLADIVNGLRWTKGLPINVLLGPAVLRLSVEQKPEPDLFVIPLGGDESHALLVLEIVSKSHKNYDLEFKAREYREAGVPEIWYVDDHTHTLHVDRKVETGYERLILATGRVVSASLPGFWVDLAWLWADPLPNPRECLALILG